MLVESKNILIAELEQKIIDLNKENKEKINQITLELYDLNRINNEFQIKSNLIFFKFLKLGTIKVLEY
jgi:hypothetical protein